MIISSNSLEGSITKSSPLRHIKIIRIDWEESPILTIKPEQTTATILI